jgi:hypothetical protein
MIADELFLLSKLYIDRAFKLREVYTTCNSFNKGKRAYKLYVKCVTKSIEIHKLLEEKIRCFE